MWARPNASLNEEWGNIRHRRDTPIARHMMEFHDGNPTSLKFLAIEVIRPSERGGDWDNKILRKETEWIYRLGSLEPFGLNENLHFGCFI